MPHVSILELCPRISQNAKFCPKVKILEFWDQKCLIQVFWSCNDENLLSYLKSAPSNMSKINI